MRGQSAAKGNLPCGVAVVELTNGKSSEGVVIGLDANVRNDAENGEEKEVSSNVSQNKNEME